MTANQLLGRMAARGVRITLDGDELKVDAPAGMLTDEDRDRLKCYKTGLLWRLRHPEGDPDVSGYQVPVLINGEQMKIPLDQLIVEGKAIIEEEDLHPKTKGFDPDMWAASVALRRREGRPRH
jgi:tubulysin polyketide synthase-like protein